MTPVSPTDRVTPISPTDASCASQHCITCGDDGVPMTVVRVDEQRELALCVDEDGAKSTVEIGLIDPVAPGAQVLVHAGTALVALDSEYESNQPEREVPA